MIKLGGHVKKMWEKVAVCPGCVCVYVTVHVGG